MTAAYMQNCFPNTIPGATTWTSPPLEIVTYQSLFYADLATSLLTLRRVCCDAWEAMGQPMPPELWRSCHRREPGQTAETGWAEKVTLPTRH